MSRYDWLLFLHVASAFALVASLVLYTVLIAVVWNKDVPSDVARLFRISKVGDVLIAVGSIGVLVFGIWLAIDVGRLRGMGRLGDRCARSLVRHGRVRARGRERSTTPRAIGRKALAREGNNAPNAELRTLVQDRRGLWFHTGGVIVVLLLLIDMIFKPGA